MILDVMVAMMLAGTERRVDNQLGVFGADAKGACAVFRPEAVQPSGFARFLDIGSELEFSGSVEEELAEPCSALAERLVEGRSFRVELNGTVPGRALGVAILGTSAGVAPNRPLEYTLEGGVHVTFRQCASSEGVHYTGWLGEPLVSTRVYHGYVYLGYDTEADCTDQETVE